MNIKAISLASALAVSAIAPALPASAININCVPTTKGREYCCAGNKGCYYQGPVTATNATPSALPPPPHKPGAHSPIELILEMLHLVQPS